MAGTADDAVGDAQVSDPGCSFTGGTPVLLADGS